MIKFLYGENEYSVSRAEGRIREAFIEKHGAQSVEIYDGSQVQISDLPQMLQGQTLFSDATLTVLRGASTNKSLWDELADVLERSPDADLLIVEGKPDKRTRTFKWLQKNAETKECKLLDERETITWLETEARGQGIALSRELAIFLVHHSGTDQWRLYNDLIKLSLAGKPLSRDLIKELIEPNPSATVFELLDAILAGRHKDAQRILDIVRIVEDPYKFMGLFVSQLYALAVCVAADHRPSQTIAKDAGIHPYVAQKTQALARNIDRERLKEMVAVVEQGDLSLKSSGGDPWTIIAATIGRL